MKLEKRKFIVLDANKKKHSFVNPLQEKVKYNNKETSFQFGVDKNGFKYVLYNNQRYFFEVLDKSQNKYTVMVDGVSYTLSVESSFSLKRKEILEKQSAQQKTVQVIAPMSGLIVDVLSSEGEKISKNDSLLILEAMKMQNEIASEFSGTVKKIHVRNGDTVMKDEVLVEIEIDTPQD